MCVFVLEFIKTPPDSLEEEKCSLAEVPAKSQTPKPSIDMLYAIH